MVRPVLARLAPAKKRSMRESPAAKSAKRPVVIAFTNSEDENDDSVEALLAALHARKVLLPKSLGHTPTDSNSHALFQAKHIKLKDAARCLATKAMMEASQVVQNHDALLVQELDRAYQVLGEIEALRSPPS